MSGLRAVWALDFVAQCLYRGESFGSWGLGFLRGMDQALSTPIPPLWAHTVKQNLKNRHRGHHLSGQARPNHTNVVSVVTTYHCQTQRASWPTGVTQQQPIQPLSMWGWCLPIQSTCHMDGLPGIAHGPEAC